MLVRAALLVLASVGLATGLVALVGGDGPAEGHAGHPQKKLFDERWHYQPDGDYASYMNLTTSEFWYQCGSSEADCQSRWGVPGQAAVNDWNGQPMTVDFNQVPGHDIYNDINLFFVDAIGGDPSLLGFAPSYDENEDLCDFACDVWYAEMYASDGAHTGPYGTPEERQGTVAHELGHDISLRHESVNANESVHYDCGEDNTGPIPHSIMSYNCIDPVELGGLGIYLVQPWDVCGVNHAYYDPAFGFAGCGDEPTPTATPTTGPTPPPGQEFWGDTDCGNQFNIGDAINTARKLVNLGVFQQAGCPPLGTGTVLVDGVLRTWGDTDCGGAFNIGDAINIARKLVNLIVNVQPGCPGLGTAVTIGDGGPTSTATPPPGQELHQCATLAVPAPIPDDDPSGINLTIEFTESVIIDSLGLCINIAHDWIGDLYITLTHEDTGMSVTVVLGIADGEFGDLGSCDGTQLFVYLADDEPASLDANCQNLVGSFAPHFPLSDFAGENINGTWTLNVADLAPPDTGSVLGATLYYLGQ